MKLYFLYVIVNTPIIFIKDYMIVIDQLTQVAIDIFIILLFITYVVDKDIHEPNISF